MVPLTFQRRFLANAAVHVVVARIVVVGRSRWIGGRGVGRKSPVLLPATTDAIQAHSFLQHAHADAFLEATSLTRLPPPFIDLAVVGGRASVLDVTCNR